MAAKFTCAVVVKVRPKNGHTFRCPRNEKKQTQGCICDVPRANYDGLRRKVFVSLPADPEVAGTGHRGVVLHPVPCMFRSAALPQRPILVYCVARGPDKRKHEVTEKKP